MILPIVGLKIYIPTINFSTVSSFLLFIFNICVYPMDINSIWTFQDLNIALSLTPEYINKYADTDGF